MRRKRELNSRLESIPHRGEGGGVGLRQLLHVSRRGANLYLFLPRDLCRAFDLQPGDRVEVVLGRHFRPLKEEEPL